ncbi:MAG: hypothetical protein AABY22_29425 [Nanoarchaeota archaeon]
MATLKVTISLEFSLKIPVEPVFTKLLVEAVDIDLVLFSFRSFIAITKS